MKLKIMIQKLNHANLSQSKEQVQSMFSKKGSGGKSGATNSSTYKGQPKKGICCCVNHHFNEKFTAGR